jgi:hypothetical protein
MENEKMQFVLAEGVTKTEIVLREGAAVKELEPKAPVKTMLSGVIGAPAEYLLKRIRTGQFAQERSHLIVDREKISLSLVINENDEYLRGQVDGKLEFNPKFNEFGINTGKLWTPAELGMFFKMNRAFFPDKATNMKLVTELTHFTATVHHAIEKSVKETGDRTDSFSQAVNSNLPKSFMLNIPIFKGMKAEALEVETFAHLNGREISLVLISPGANQTLEEIRNQVIDEQLRIIREIAPEIAIIEI